jgi:aspartyl-tRNA(Asn)/glutamyl-tRNA(Gln) amidotransferase subunit A
MTDITQLSIRELRELLLTREISPVDIVEACAEQIRIWEPSVKAFAEFDRERVLDEARLLTQTMNGDGRIRPLFGIPVGYKDVIDVAGYRTKAGGQVYGAEPAKQSAFVHQRLQTCGSICMGKLTTHEIAAGVETPPTSNPHDFGRIPGGSSGGSAAAVATGMVIGAIGTDTGGSGRIPAALCGVVGFKPTFGLIGRSGIVPRAISLDTVAFLGKTVDDVRRLFEASIGRDSSDPACALQPEASLQRADSKIGEGLNPRIGYPLEWVQHWVPVEMRRSFEEALHALASAGYEVVEVTAPSLEETLYIRRHIILPETAHHHGEAYACAPELFGKDVAAGIESGKQILAVDYLDALSRREHYARRFASIFEEVDLFVTPTTVVPAPLKGTTVIELPTGALPLIDALTLLTTPMNLARTPAISIPIGKSPTGLPIGLQICAKSFADQTLLQYAEAMQKDIFPASVTHVI